MFALHSDRFTTLALVMLTLTLTHRRDHTTSTAPPTAFGTASIHGCTDIRYPPGAKLPLVVLDAAEATRRNAQCLGGGPPAFYYRNATSVGAARKWVVHFKGGGVCQSVEQCALSVHGPFGSSEHFPAHVDVGGVLDPDPYMNPLFAEWHHVMLWYCDGGTWNSDRKDPIILDDPAKPAANQSITMYFQGNAIIRYQLDVLLHQYGLSNADAILLSGGSVGGSAVMLHADDIRAMVPNAKVRGLVISGWWSPAVRARDFAWGMDTPESAAIQQKPAHHEACLAAMAKDEQWLCGSVYTSVYFPFVQTPLFIANSVLDSCDLGSMWKGLGHFMSAKPGDCLDRKRQFTSCHKWEMLLVMERQQQRIQELTKARRDHAGFGAFLHSCLDHGGLRHTSAFWNYRSADGMSLGAALARWWHDDIGSPGFAERATNGTHWHMPRPISDEAPYQPDPTCLAIAGADPK